MKNILLIALALMCLARGRADAQDAAAPLEAAATALGAAGLSSVQFSGWGFDYIFGQAYDGDSPWPRFNLPGFTITIDYRTPALRDDRRRTQGENPPLGGGFQPMVGEQRQIWLMSGAYAWDVAGQAAVPAAAERDQRSALEGRLAQVWLTPHGFVNAALTGHASVRSETVRGAIKTVVRFTTPTKATFEGVLNEQHLVERIETRVNNPVLGDVVFEATFADYKRFGAVMFPTHIVQREGGYPVLDVTVTAVIPNAPVNIEVPATVRQASMVPAAIEAEPVAEGVWALSGAARSVLVEFRDYLLVIDAPETEARSTAVISAIRKVAPSKPIRYVVNTHAHFDHAGGLRTYAAEGATIVTYQGNVPFFEQAWANPRTISPDRLAVSGRKPVFEGVTGTRTFTDGSRDLVVYHYAGNRHNPGLLMAYLPIEKILIEADSFTPAASPSDMPAGLENLVQFYDTVQRLSLDVAQVIPIHGRITTLDEARKAIEAYKYTQLWVK